MNERSRLNTPTASTDELRGAQRDPGSTSNLFSREASARLPDVKLPKVWSDQIRLWFLHVENLFQLYGVASQTQRFQFVVCALQCCQLRKARIR